MKYIHKVLLFCILLGTAQTTLGGVTTIIISFNSLFRPDAQLIKEYIQSTLNLRNYISLIFRGIPTPEETKNQLFDFLATVPALNDLFSDLVPHSPWLTNYPPYETEGHKFSPIFCQMLVSTTLEHEKAIFRRILHQLEHHSNISSTTRRKILKAVIETLFQTKLMNKFVNPLLPVVKLFYQLQTNYNLILVGNVPGHAWQELLQRQKSESLKKLFPETHRYISGELQMLKTSPEIYERMIQEHDLNPQECLVIDSTSNNLLYAKELNMKTLAFDANKDNIDYFKQSLEHLLKS